MHDFYKTKTYTLI